MQAYSSPLLRHWFSSSYFLVFHPPPTSAGLPLLDFPLSLVFASITSSHTPPGQDGSHYTPGRHIHVHTHIQKWTVKLVEGAAELWPCANPRAAAGLCLQPTGHKKRVVSLPWRMVWIHTHSKPLRPCTLSACQTDTPTVIMSEFSVKETNRVHMCAHSMCVLYLYLPLCYHTVLSQDYIPAEQRAGEIPLIYLSLSLSLRLSPCLCLYLSFLSFADHILTACLCAAVARSSRVRHTQTHSQIESLLGRGTWGKY